MTFKQGLRQKLLRKLRQQPERDRLERSLQIGRSLRRSPLYRRAKRILCYVAFDGEVETRPILKQALKEGKRVAVPVTFKEKREMVAVEIQDLKQDLVRIGAFGISEPAFLRRLNPKELDLIIVPGVAFDREGQRLGRGGGYFDRFLEKLPPQVPRIGLAFRFQLLKKIPWESHDQPVTRLITD